MNIEDEIKPTDTASVQDFLNTIKDHRRRMIQEASPGAPKPGIFLLTVTFQDHPQLDPNTRTGKGTKSYQHYEPDQILELIHGYQSKFYHHILNQTVPSNHYPKRKKDYPIALSFIDLSGQKFNRGNFLKIPHTHSLVIVPAKTLPRFQRLIDDGFRLQPRTPKTKPIKTVDCQELPWTKAELSPTLSYSAKFYRSGYAKSFPEDVRSWIFSIYG